MFIDIVLVTFLFLITLAAMVGFIMVGLKIASGLRPKTQKKEKSNLLVKIGQNIALKMLYASFFYAPTFIILMLVQFIFFATCDNQNNNCCIFIEKQLEKVFDFIGSLIDLSPQSFIYIAILIAIPHFLEKLIKKIGRLIKSSKIKT